MKRNRASRFGWASGAKRFTRLRKARMPASAHGAFAKACCAAAPMRLLQGTAEHGIRSRRRISSHKKRAMEDRFSAPGRRKRRPSGRNDRFRVLSVLTKINFGFKAE